MQPKHWSEIRINDLPAIAEPSPDVVLDALVRACQFVEEAVALGGAVVFVGEALAPQRAARQSGQSYLAGGDLAKAVGAAPATPDRLQRLIRLADVWKLRYLLRACAEWSVKEPQYRVSPDWQLPEQPDVAVILLGPPYDTWAAREHGIPSIATQTPGEVDENVDFALWVREYRDDEMANIIADAISSAILSGRQQLSRKYKHVRPLSAEASRLSHEEIRSLQARIDELDSAVDVDDVEADWLDA